MSSKILEVKDLSIAFCGLKAVDNLSFDINKGEIFGLIGPNGAGKTTVFNCITQFYNANSGDVYFYNGEDGSQKIDLNALRVDDVINTGIVRTFQNVELVKEFEKFSRSYCEFLISFGDILYLLRYFKNYNGSC